MRQGILVDQFHLVGLVQNLLVLVVQLAPLVPLTHFHLVVLGHQGYQESPLVHVVQAVHQIRLVQCHQFPRVVLTIGINTQ